MSDETTNNTGDAGASATFTYDMAKTLKAQGTKPSVEQLNEAIASVEQRIKSLSADLATAAIETGKSSGKVHALAKSPYAASDDDKAAAEGEGKKTLEIFSTIGDEIRHLSKLVSWRDRAAMNLPDFD